jgi:transketolase
MCTERAGGLKLRNTFVVELVDAARAGKEVALVVGDLGYKVVEPFADEFPHLFFNAGVAEQNMMGLAAGMASEGVHVFVYSIANFPTFRCAEQIRNDVDYHKLPVTIVSVGGGLAYGNLGYSHHAVQDYALIRTMPNMLIAAPGDPMEVRACMRYLTKARVPSYLRLGKVGEPNYHAEIPEIQPGRWVKLHSGASRSVILSTGACLPIAMDWLEKEKYANSTVYSMPLWSMASKSAQLEQLQAWDEVVTLEDHLHDAGFGSWLLEAKSRSDNVKCVVRNIALGAEVCGTVGSQRALNRLGGILP